LKIKYLFFFLFRFPVPVPAAKRTRGNPPLISRTNGTNEINLQNEKKRLLTLSDRLCAAISS